jgi:hypothetical protein
VVEHPAEATVAGMLGWIKAESERAWWHAANGQLRRPPSVKWHRFAARLRLGP